MKKELLIVYLHASDLTASWIRLDEANNIIQNVAKQKLDQLTAQENCDLLVFVPPQDVLITSADLPKMPRQRLLQALPFALEEQLIDDVSLLHFAISEYKINSHLPVAIVSHEKITTWLNLFSEINLTPRALIPAIFLLPYKEQTWEINSFDNQSIVRTGKFSGFACETQNLDVLLELKLAEENSSEIKIAHTHFSPEKLLEIIAPSVNSLLYINLLQGEYQPKLQGSKTKKIWLTTFYLALACLAVGFLGNIISYFILNSQTNQLEVRINKIYYDNFPNATSVVAPKARMTEKLQKMVGLENTNNFLSLLAQSAKSLAQSSSVQIKNLEFRDKQLSLNLIAPTFDNLDEFKKSLLQQGLVVKQQSAAIVGEEVKATLLIQTGA